ncbi:hypothetical protein DRJ17_01300 [Candidatus Woesearchaeota archaeon]|nr:MAG: hypothetical protein DRJ17_01300 [Candidatus Woesearchaeota archaeon]
MIELSDYLNKEKKLVYGLIFLVGVQAFGIGRCTTNHAQKIKENNISCSNCLISSSNHAYLDSIDESLSYGFTLLDNNFAINKTEKQNNTDVIDLTDNLYLTIAKEFFEERFIEKYNQELIEIGKASNPRYEKADLDSFLTEMKKQSAKEYNKLIYDLNSAFIENIRFMYDTVPKGILESNQEDLVAIVQNTRENLDLAEHEDDYLKYPSDFILDFKFYAQLKRSAIMDLISKDMFVGNLSTIAMFAKNIKSNLHFYCWLRTVEQNYDLFNNNREVFIDLSGDPLFVESINKLDCKTLKEYVSLYKESKNGVFIIYDMKNKNIDFATRPYRQKFDSKFNIPDARLERYAQILGKFSDISLPFYFDELLEEMNKISCLEDLDDFFDDMNDYTNLEDNNGNYFMDAINIVKALRENTRTRPNQATKNLTKLKNKNGDLLFSPDALIDFVRLGYKIEDAKFLHEKYGLNGDNIVLYLFLKLNEKNLRLYDTDKPNCLFIFPRSDWNGAFTNKIYFQFFRNLNLFYDVITRKVATEDEVYELIKETPNIELLILAGHGSQTSLSLAEVDLRLFEATKGEKYAIDIFDDEFKEYLNMLHPNATLFNISCSNGQGKNHAINLANVMHKWSNRTIISFSGPARLSDFSVKSYYPLRLEHNDSDKNLEYGCDLYVIMRKPHLNEKFIAELVYNLDLSQILSTPKIKYKVREDYSNKRLSDHPTR